LANCLRDDLNSYNITKLKGKKKVPHLPSHPRFLILGMFFFIGKISPIKFQKLGDFGSFQSPKVKGKK
jgi:hypothetical protein